MTKTQWSKTGKRVTVDTRGISAHTADGKKALKMAQETISSYDRSGALSGSSAIKMNDRLTTTASFVDSVRRQQQSAKNTSSASDSYIRARLSSKYGR